MENKTNPWTRSVAVAARIAIVSLCVAVAPMALAQSAPAAQPAPEGANYLLSHGHNYHQSKAFEGGSVGSPKYAAFDTPEPSTWGMFGLGLAMIGLAALRRRRGTGSSSD